MYKNKTIAFPYKMGCHRGGGDWDIVYKMIEDAFKDSDCDVLICEYDEEVEKERIRSRLLSIGKELLYDDIDETEVVSSTNLVIKKEDNIAFTFDVTKEEDKAINTWVKDHTLTKHRNDGYTEGIRGIGGRYAYEFLTTSIGEIGTIKCSCGEEFCFRKLTRKGITKNV
jgi:hypothetical protein